jgi:phosphoglycolate phosphatase
MEKPVESKALFDAIIFDLDGTLVNSGQDLANSVNFAREQLGLPEISEELVMSYIGDGAPTLIRRAMGVEADPARIQQAYDLFLDHYHQHLMDNTYLYPGVMETLDRLDGCVLAVLTNKNVTASDRILESLGVRRKFSVVYGGDSFEQKKPDPVGLIQILRDHQVLAERALIVGDSRVDVLTGQNAGVKSCGVTWGMSSHTLAQVSPDYLIRTMEELVPIVFS